MSNIAEDLMSNYLKSYSPKRYEKLIAKLCKLGKQSEEYQRSLVLGLEFCTYIVSDEVYNETGLHSIEFPVNINFKTLSDITLIGSVEILYHFAGLMNDKFYSFHIISSDLNINKNYKKLNIKYFLQDNIKYDTNILNQILTFHNNLIDFNYSVLTSKDMYKLTNLFINNNISFKFSEIVLKAHHVFYYNINALDDLKLLFNYFDNVYISLDSKSFYDLLVNFNLTNLNEILLHLKNSNIKFRITDDDSLNLLPLFSALL